MILGVSFNDQQQNCDFAQKYAFNFPLLCDTERKVGLAYGAADDEKSTHARRVGVIIGPDGRIKHYFKKVDARAFPAEALGLV